MAVGMIITCPKCGLSYDEGRGRHWQYHCDAELEKQAGVDREVAEFNAKTIDERFEILFREIRDLSQSAERSDQIW